jgi:hypothetical protein
MIGRNCGYRSFRKITRHADSNESHRALKAYARFGECSRGRLLHEIVKDSGGPDGDNDRDQATDGKRAHLLAPDLLKFQHVAEPPDAA